MAEGRFSIETVFKAVDRMTAPVNRMSNRVGRATRRMQRGIDRLAMRAQFLNKTFKAAIAVGAVGGLFLMQSAMASTITTGVKLEQTLVNAAAKFPGGIKKGTKEFELLERTAMQVGKTTEFTASQAAEGLNFLAMAGFNAETSVAALPLVVDLATAANTDLARATDIASDALGAFGLATDDAAQLQKNLTRINDVMAKTVTTSNTDMEQFFETIKLGAPIATAAGASIETFSAMAGTLANSGIKASVAGTTLKNVFVRLAAPVGAAAKQLKRLGVETQDSEGNLRDSLDILGDLEKQLKGLGSAERSKVLFDIFGKIPLAGVNVLLDAGSDKLKEYRRQLEGATGASKEMAATMRDTLQGRINTMKSAFEGLQITIFKLEDTAFGGLIERITEVIRSIDSAIFKNQEFSKSVLDNIIKTLLGAAGVFLQLLVVIGTVKFAIVLLNTVIAIGRGIWLGYLAAVWLVKGALLLLKGVLVVVKLAMVAFNIVMALNPIGLVVLAIFALIGVGILLVKHWDTVKEFFLFLWDVFKKNPISTLLAIFFPFLALPILLIKNWRIFRDFIVKTWDLIVEKTMKAINMIKGPLGVIAKPLKALTSGVGGLIKNVFTSEPSDQPEPQAPQVVSPEAGTAKLIDEKSTTNKTELTIKDETGRAEMNGKPGTGVSFNLAESGAF